jgi:hypothetical protein
MAMVVAPILEVEGQGDEAVAEGSGVVETTGGGVEGAPALVSDVAAKVVVGWLRRCGGGCERP